jgi:hypothetical protein
MADTPLNTAMRYGLLAPAKQSFFMLGLTLTTKEPEQHHDLSTSEWLHINTLLISIFNLYAQLFLPSGEDDQIINPALKRNRDIAMPAFLHYFTQFDLASINQLQARIVALYSPFDKAITELLEFNSTQMLAVAGWIKRGLDTRLAPSFRSREEFMEGITCESWRPPANLLAIDRNELEAQFGRAVAGTFWRLFVSVRGDQVFEYMTDRNPAEASPIFEIDSGSALCPVVNALYRAIEGCLSSVLLNSTHKLKVSKHRDKALEERTLSTFRLLLGEEAEYWASCYETPHSQYEHDLIVRWRRHLFVVESKASPVRAPLLNPEKAFTRIHDDFRSDKGIQKAYEQARRIRDAVYRGDVVSMFNRKGQALAVFNRVDIEHVWCICVTAADYGGLSVDLSLLLRKDDDAEYPWSVCISSFEKIVRGFQCRRWGPEMFLVYLTERALLHGRLKGNLDELDIAGLFLHRSTLEDVIRSDAERVHISEWYSEVFVQIESGGPNITEDDLELNPRPPTMMSPDMYMCGYEGVRGKSVRELEESVEEVTKVKNRSAGRSLRNSPCPCGSGLKFKNCHGRM